MDKKIKPVATGTRLFFAIGLVFVVAGLAVVLLVNHGMRQQALSEAESKAFAILDRNLATHTYFSQTLKPKLFKVLEPVMSKEYFEPIWMSSTYAIRKIEKYFDKLSPEEYYYKECAINARSPENEANTYERKFLEDLNANPDLKKRSGIREIGGRPFFVTLRRGEAMEESCLRCHSTPDRAPGDLVKRYGPERGFHREVGDVVHAISIRVPLAAAYANANRFSMQLSGFLFVVLVVLYLAQFWLNKRLLLTPLNKIRDKALDISASKEHLGEEIALPSGRELMELTVAFNTMSTTLRHNIDNLEDIVEERTSALVTANRQLEQEIEERKHTEKALRESEEKFSKAFQASPIWVVISSLEDGRYIEVNETFLEMTGYSRDEVIGRTSTELGVWDDPGVRDGLVEITRKRGNVKNQEVVKRTKDGERLVMLFSAETISIGGETRLLSVSTDITERKKMEGELLKTQKLESIGILAGGIAHDFNNLLTAILGNISLAKEIAVTGREATDILEKAERSCLKAEELTKQLITFASGGAPIKKAADIRETIRDAVRFALSGSMVKCDFEVDEELWPVEVDIGQFRQVIYNLCINADQAMPEGGELAVTAANVMLEGDHTLPIKDGKYVRISFKDTGPGIPGDKLDKIFDPFFTTREGASGLGLSTAYSIVDQHGGYIMAESEVGVGTIFHVYLPSYGRRVK